MYYESPDTLWVNLFVPSTAECALGGATMTMETGFPEGDSATIRVALKKPTASRCQGAGGGVHARGAGFAVAVNGAAIEQPKLDTLYDPVAGGRVGGVDNEAEARSSTYVFITRTWTNGDMVTLALPKSLHLEPTPDNANVTAIMWGPLALAADLGPRNTRRGEEDPSGPVPVIVSESRSPDAFLEPGGRAGEFRTRGETRWLDRAESAPPMSFAPFYRTHRRTYSVYVDLLDPMSFASLKGVRDGERARATAMNSATIGRVVPGDAESERAANYQSEPKDRQAGRGNRRTSRAGTGGSRTT